MIQGIVAEACDVCDWILQEKQEPFYCVKSIVVVLSYTVLAFYKNDSQISLKWELKADINKSVDIHVYVIEISDFIFAKSEHSCYHLGHFRIFLTGETSQFNVIEMTFLSCEMEQSGCICVD